MGKAHKQPGQDATHRAAGGKPWWLRLRKVPREWCEPLVECYREAVLAIVRRMDVSDYRLAKCAGVSPSMVGLVMRSKSLPGLEVAGRFCYVDSTTLAQVLWDMLRKFRSGKGAPRGGAAQREDGS